MPLLLVLALELQNKAFLRRIRYHRSKLFGLCLLHIRRHNESRCILIRPTLRFDEVQSLRRNYGCECLTASDTSSARHRCCCRYCYQSRTKRIRRRHLPIPDHRLGRSWCPSLRVHKTEQMHRETKINKKTPANNRPIGEVRQKCI